GVGDRDATAGPTRSDRPRPIQSQEDAVTFRRTASFGAANSAAPVYRPEPVISEVEPAPELDLPAPPAPISQPVVAMAEEARPIFGAEHDVKPSATAPEKCANVIAAGSSWQGSLAIDDSVRIDGRVSGDIEAKGTIHISEGA